MADISAIKLPSGVTYTLKDKGALQLTGGAVTGPVSFNDTISVDDATIGSLVVNGSASFTNGVKASSYNGGQPMYFVKGTQTAATNLWTGNLPSEITSYYDGLTIDYFLPYAGNSTAATLNLSGLGAKPVYVGNTASSAVTTHYPANTVLHLTYVIASNLNSGNGCWKVTTYQNSTYWYTTVYCTTAAATAAKAGACSFYKLAIGYFPLTIQYANTSASALTLNINSKGAKPIYINGTASSASNYTLPEGQYIAYYDGTNYHLRTDGKIPGNISGDAATVGGHTVGVNVPSTAKFTDTTYSAGTGISLSGTTFSNSGVTSVTTTAGTHSAISSKTGAVSFNVPTKTSHLTNDSGFITNAGVTGVKGDSESSYRTGNVNITAANIGAAAVSHTHTPNQIAGTSTYGLSGNIDMITGIRIGAYASNKSFGLPANAIVIEYSNDGGATWTDYGATDAQKRDLFSETRGTGFAIGKTNKDTKSVNDQLRVTIEPVDRYVSFNALYIWMSTNGNTCTVDLERSTIGAKDTFTTVFSGQPISGWSGNNIRYFSGGMFGGGSTQTSNNYKYRLTFKMTALGSSTYGPGSITDIRFLGDAVHSSPNNMVSKNHLYTWDSSLNATFPFKLTATGGFIGDLTGTASGNTKYWGNQSSTLGSGTPAAATKTFWENSVPNASVSFGYNTSGVEYALAYARGGTAGYGSVLKWGYNDKYIRILRRNASNWSDSDWAKIDAGNADTVNGLTVQTAVPSGAKFTDTVTTATTTGSGNAVTAISASNGALTVTKGSTFLTSHQTVTNKAATLSYGSTTTIATIGSTNITVTMPAAPTAVWG